MELFVLILVVVVVLILLFIAIEKFAPALGADPRLVQVLEGILLILAILFILNRAGVLK